MGTSSGDEKDAAKLVDMPIWAFHNSGDMFAGVWNDTSMVAKVNSLGGHAKVNTYGALGHDVWETVYAQGELFNWMLAQHKSARGATGMRAMPSATPTQAESVHVTVAVPSHTDDARTFSSPY